MAKKQRKGKYTLFLGEMLDAENAALHFDEKVADFGTSYANLENADARRGLLETACWFVQHKFKLKAVSAALGLKGDTGAGRPFQIARAIVVKNHRPPKGCETWPQAFEMYSLTALYNAVKGRRPTKSLADQVAAAVNKLSKQITSLENPENDRGWYIEGFGAWLGAALSTQTWPIESLVIMTPAGLADVDLATDPAAAVNE